MKQLLGYFRPKIINIFKGFINGLTSNTSRSGVKNGFLNVNHHKAFLRMILKAMTDLHHPKKAFQTLGGQKAVTMFIQGLISCGINVFS